MFHFMFSEVQDLIQKCLSIRPSERPTVEEILEHSWLHDSTYVHSSQKENKIVRNNSETDSIDGQSMSSQESIQ